MTGNRLREGLAADGFTIIRDVRMDLPSIPLPTLEDFVTAIGAMRPDYPALRLSQAGTLTKVPTRLADHVYQRRSVDLDGLAAEILGGKTLVVDGAHLLHPSIGRLALAISDLVGVAMYANGYLSAGSQGAFGPHADATDTVIVQCTGSKDWRIGPEGDEAKFTLYEGDALIVRAGTIHDASASRRHSFHVTHSPSQPSLLDIMSTVFRETITPAVTSSLEKTGPAGTVVDAAAVSVLLHDVATRLLRIAESTDAVDAVLARIPAPWHLTPDAIEATVAAFVSDES